MNNQPTPETERVKAAYHTNWDDLLNHARKLERERDEAIRQRDETNESSVFSCNFYYEEKLKAERERDEAREELRTAVQERHDFHWELQDAIRKRNEAREEINRYREKLDLLPISWDV
jgi:uncharacterized coiled-coil DUF342 family protein